MTCNMKALWKTISKIWRTILGRPVLEVEHKSTDVEEEDDFYFSELRVVYLNGKKKEAA